MSASPASHAAHASATALRTLAPVTGLLYLPPSLKNVMLALGTSYTSCTYTDSSCGECVPSAASAGGGVGLIARGNNQNQTCVYYYPKPPTTKTIGAEVNGTKIGCGAAM